MREKKLEEQVSFMCKTLKSAECRSKKSKSDIVSRMQEHSVDRFCPIIFILREKKALSVNFPRHAPQA